MKFTINGAYRSNNHLVRVRSAELAEDYLVEFEEMFIDLRFGAGSPANMPFPVFNLDGTQVEVYFSPDDGTINRLLELVREHGRRGHLVLPRLFELDLKRPGARAPVPVMMTAGEVIAAKEYHDGIYTRPGTERAAAYRLASDAMR